MSYQSQGSDCFVLAQVGFLLKPVEHMSGISNLSSLSYITAINALILLSLALFRAPLCLWSSWCYICIKKFFAHILLFTF